MALIKVRATALGFNGGPNAEIPRNGVWGFRGDSKLMVSKDDRGLKRPGDVFMIEESKFTSLWMERLDPLPEEVKAEFHEAVSAQMASVPNAPRKAGRPKKTV